MKTQPAIHRTFFVGALALGVWLNGLGAARAIAQEKKTEQKGKLSAEEILDKYVDATGGLKAYDRINNRVIKGTMEIPAMGLKLELTQYAAKPTKTYSIAQAPELGSMEEGNDGITAWEKSTITGSRVLDSAEAAEAIREAAFDKYTYWREQYSKVELAGEDSVGGELCYKVVATPKAGKPQTLYFEKGSYLLEKVAMVYQHQMGELPIEMMLSDYKAVDSILIPHRLVTNMAGQQRVDVITSVQHNADLPKDIFAVPADVQALVKQK